jgi:hypothetical protein
LGPFFLIDRPEGEAFFCVDEPFLEPGIVADIGDFIRWRPKGNRPGGTGAGAVITSHTEFMDSEADRFIDLQRKVGGHRF